MTLYSPRVDKSRIPRLSKHQESRDISNKGSGVPTEGPSAAYIRESRIHGNETGVSVGPCGVVSIENTNVDMNRERGIGSASYIYILSSTVDRNGLGIQLGYGAAAVLQSSDVSSNGPGERIGAGGSSIHLADSKLTNNGVAGIWGESTFVTLYGRNAISGNTGDGIALGAGSGLADRAWNGMNLVNNNGGCGLHVIGSSFAIDGGGVLIDQPGGCAIGCETALAICDPAAVIDGEIGGCGSGCPSQ